MFDVVECVERDEGDTARYGDASEPNMELVNNPAFLVNRLTSIGTFSEIAERSQRRALFCRPVQVLWCGSVAEAIQIESL